MVTSKQLIEPETESSSEVLSLSFVYTGPPAIRQLQFVSLIASWSLPSVCSVTSVLLQI